MSKGKHEPDNELLAGLLLAGPKPEKKKDEETPGEGEESEEMDADAQLAAVADELFDAMQADDREGFRESLRSYVDMCRMMDEA